MLVQQRKVRVSAVQLTLNATMHYNLLSVRQCYNCSMLYRYVYLDLHVAKAQLLPVLRRQC
jgi:hypothetical protein